MNTTATLTPGANAAIGASAGRIIVRHRSAPGIDVNLTAFVLNDDGQATGDSDIVFYNQPRHPFGMAQFSAPKDVNGQKEHAIDFDFSRAPKLSRIQVTSAFKSNEDPTFADTHTSPPAPCSVALYIDGDNQSPAIAEDLLASVCDDWRLEVSRVVLAGNDHGQSIPRWQAALFKQVAEDRVRTLEVPRTPRGGRSGADFGTWRRHGTASPATGFGPHHLAR